jgi:hypothetical protein
LLKIVQFGKIRHKVRFIGTTGLQPAKRLDFDSCHLHYQSPADPTRKQVDMNKMNSPQNKLFTDGEKKEIRKTVKPLVDIMGKLNNWLTDMGPDQACNPKIIGKYGQYAVDTWRSRCSHLRKICAFFFENKKQIQRLDRDFVETLDRSFGLLLDEAKMCVTLSVKENELDLLEAMSSIIATVESIYHQIIAFMQELPTAKEAAQKNDSKQNSGGEAEDAGNIPPYLAIDLSQRLITVGVTNIRITSEKVWDFVKALCSNARQGITLWNAPNWKNAIDVFRSELKEDRCDYKQFVERTKSGRQVGYTLNPNVKILRGSQVAIRRTKQKK